VPLRDFFMPDRRLVYSRGDLHTHQTFKDWFLGFFLRRTRRSGPMNVGGPLPEEVVGRNAYGEVRLLTARTFGVVNYEINEPYCEDHTSRPLFDAGYDLAQEVFIYPRLFDFLASHTELASYRFFDEKLVNPNFLSKIQAIASKIRDHTGTRYMLDYLPYVNEGAERWLNTIMAVHNYYFLSNSKTTALNLGNAVRPHFYAGPPPHRQ